MKLAKFLFFTCLTFLILNCEDNNPKQLKKQNKTKNNQDEILVEKIMDTILIDGIANEKTWEKSSWYPINQVWIGEQVDSSDFTGRYKLSWSKEALYVLVEIKDDFLVDKIKNPLERWWDDDCVEIFIDEDNSGGNHQFNHNAFAYHVGLNGDVVDLDGKDIVVFGQNATPDIILQTILDAYTWVVEPTITYVADAGTAMGEVVLDPSKIVLLAEPVLSVASLPSKVGNMKSIDLQAEWAKITGDNSYPQAGIFVHEDLDKDEANAAQETCETLGGDWALESL